MLKELEKLKLLQQRSEQTWEAYLNWYTSQNKKEKHGVSTSEISRSLYDEFSTASNRHTIVEPKENTSEF